MFRPQNNPTTFASLGGTETTLPYDGKEFGRHNLGDVSRPESLAALPEEVEIDVKGRPVMLAGAEPAIPSKAAARKAEEKKGRAPVPTLMANRPEPMPVVAEKPARITIADADGDSSAYQKLLGSLFKKDAAPATPATDAVVAPEPAKAAGAEKPATKVAALKDHSVKAVKPEAGRPQPASTGSVKAKASEPDAE